MSKKNKFSLFFLFILFIFITLKSHARPVDLEPYYKFPSVEYKSTSGFCSGSDSEGTYKISATNPEDCIPLAKESAGEILFNILQGGSDRHYAQDSAYYEINNNLVTYYYSWYTDLNSVVYTISGKSVFQPDPYFKPPCNIDNTYTYNDTLFCKEIDYSYTDVNCDYSGNTIFSFALNNSNPLVCFQIDPDKQCHIIVSPSGSYELPESLGAAEPVECSFPVLEVEIDDDPNPEPTPEIDIDYEVFPVEDTVVDNSLDGINLINKNLKSIDNNMVNGFEGNHLRLDRLTEETQNSNELLLSIKNLNKTANSSIENIESINSDVYDQLVKIELNTRNSNDDNTNPDDNVSPLPPSNNFEDVDFTVNRKSDGLSNVFTESDVDAVKLEITEKNTELLDYIDLIKLESNSLFEFTPNLNTEYSKPSITVKGVEVDIGISKFSDFFKIISTAIMLAATISSIYIVLGGNKQ